MNVERVPVSHEAEVVYEGHEVRVTMNVDCGRSALRVDVSSTCIRVNVRGVPVLEVPVWSADPKSADATLQDTGVLEVMMNVDHAAAFDRVVWKRYTLR